MLPLGPSAQQMPSGSVLNQIEKAQSELFPKGFHCPGAPCLVLTPYPTKDAISTLLMTSACCLPSNWCCRAIAFQCLVCTPAVRSTCEVRAHTPQLRQTRSVLHYSFPCRPTSLTDRTLESDLQFEKLYLEKRKLYACMFLSGSLGWTHNHDVTHLDSPGQFQNCVLCTSPLTGGEDTGVMGRETKVCEVELPRGGQLAGAVLILESELRTPRPGLQPEPLV